MLEKMKAIEARLAEVERQLSDPTVYTDRERLTALSREQKELTPIAACARAYGPDGADGGGRLRHAVGPRAA